MNEPHLEQLNGKDEAMNEFDLSAYPSLDELMQELSESDEIEISPVANVRPKANDAEVSALHTEIAEMRREKREMSVNFTRAQADFENYRKRVEREKTENYRFAMIAVVNRLLPVLDNFERALATVERQNLSQPELANFLNGINLIYRQTCQVLDEMGVKPLEVIGQSFDPAFHDAVAAEPSDKFPPNTIIEEVMRGYRMGDRLIRAAMVKVSTSAENNSNGE